ncbi:MAG: UBP-type zinc finger domain-containing protein [Chloroflexi bacterium]|jgi:uncharacterized UBP type Zn finger protein|nr:UBP-type zinc finger domain-containing protein [Chloroflexota bacterium]
MKESSKKRLGLGDRLRQAIWSGRLKSGECEHLDQIQDVVPGTEGCEECMQMGDEWVHLRICLTCGHVGCCDNSKNKHATQHFHTTGHPLIQSFQPGEDWVWCYVDKVMLYPPDAE